MSLDKAIEHGKEHRKKYRGAKAMDRSCRNHGDCPYCLGNRLYKHPRLSPFLGFTPLSYPKTAKFETKSK